MLSNENCTSTAGELTPAMLSKPCDGSGRGERQVFRLRIANGGFGGEQCLALRSAS